MAKKKNCIHVGFAYKPDGLHSKKVMICCDFTGEVHDQKECDNCEYYKSKNNFPKGVDKSVGV